MNESDAANVDKKKLMGLFKKYQKDAEHVVKDKQKLKDLVKKSRAKIRSLEKLPFGMDYTEAFEFTNKNDPFHSIDRIYEMKYFDKKLVVYD